MPNIMDRSIFQQIVKSAKKTSGVLIFLTSFSAFAQSPRYEAGRYTVNGTGCLRTDFDISVSGNSLLIQARQPHLEMEAVGMVTELITERRECNVVIPVTLAADLSPANLKQRFDVSVFKEKGATSRVIVTSQWAIPGWGTANWPAISTSLGDQDAIDSPVVRSRTDVTLSSDKIKFCVSRGARGYIRVNLKFEATVLPGVSPGVKVQMNQPERPMQYEFSPVVQSCSL